MMYMICELRVVVWFSSAQVETVVNINRIVYDTYAEVKLPDDSTICRWQRGFLPGC